MSNKINEKLIDYTSNEGIKIFEQSICKNNFWYLSKYFVTQNNLTYCSIASSVMVLNALGIAPPQGDKTYDDYHIFTQKNFFTPKVLKIINLQLVKK